LVIFTVTVKKAETVNIRGAFEAAALRILREIPGLTVVSEPTPNKRGVDAVLHFAGHRAPVAVEFKQNANAATAWQLVQLAEARPAPALLLIAGKTTSKAREILEKHGIAIVDGLGNAHIELPGLFFHLEGRRRPGRAETTAPPMRLRGKAAIVAQALLQHPERAWQIKDLAEDAGVSAALTHRVLTRLESEEIVASEGTGPHRVRRVTHPTALLDLWAEENVDRPIRTSAYLLAQTPKRLIRELGDRLSHGNIDYAFTGAAGASLVAPFATALPIVELWVQATAPAEHVCDVAEANPVSDGQNVVFLQAKDDAPLAFREQIDGRWVANWFRLYVDLRRDPRLGHEQADHLRREVIKF